MEVLSPDELEALRLSLKVGFWNLLISLPLAVAVAWLLARRDFWGKELLNGLVHLSLILPPVVTGYILLILLGRRGPLGALLEDWFGIVVAFRWTGAVIAAMVMAFPVVVRPIRLSIEAIDRRLESAAGTLGASPLAVFLTVTLPLALPGIIAGAILGFAKGMGEFGATITFVSNIPGETRTLSLAIYSFIQTPGGEFAALRLTLIAVVVSMAALLASELLGRMLARRIEA
ncbi:MAG TPA: molybdate ABC transporter permease subunit [Geminicoccaceae bacterium]|nr:molybdate ABC transporter permease subunit [Geminicoccaceae bacterium]